MNILFSKMMYHNSVFVAKRIFCNQSNGTYPLKLTTEILGYFNDRARLEQFLSLPHKETFWFLEESVFKIFLVEVHGLNYFLLHDCNFIYDQKGNLYEKQEIESGFVGRENQDCRFKPGNLVAFIENDFLNIGVVAELPKNKFQVKQILDEIGSSALDSNEDAYVILTKTVTSKIHPGFCFDPFLPVSDDLKKQIEGNYNKYLSGL